SVLNALQQQLLGTGPTTRRPQDSSLQIAGCPGIQREVETAYQSILHNLSADPDLRMTDIAVLATDMATYRPALQAVFERALQADRKDAPRLRYSLIDHCAVGVSLWGRAFLGMLDLATESFARSEVFAVVLNPCFLERLGVDHADAQLWLH